MPFNALWWQRLKEWRWRSAHLRHLGVVLQSVMNYIDNARDHGSISLVCKQWNRVDSSKRKHVTIALCYSTTPPCLLRRFPCLEEFKLEDTPRTVMFNRISKDWGGYAWTWIAEIAAAFDCIKHIHFRQMFVSDGDLEVLVRVRGHMLLSLKLNKYSCFFIHILKQVKSSILQMSESI